MRLALPEPPGIRGCLLILPGPPPPASIPASAPQEEEFRSAATVQPGAIGEGGLGTEGSKVGTGQQPAVLETEEKSLKLRTMLADEADRKVFDRYAGRARRRGGS